MNDIGPQLVQFNVLGVGVQPSLPIVQKTYRRLHPDLGLLRSGRRDRPDSGWLPWCLGTREKNYN